MESITNHLLKTGNVLLIGINIAGTPDLTHKDEQLPFKQYVPNLFYRIFKTASKYLVSTVSGLTIQHNNQPTNCTWLRYKQVVIALIYKAIPLFPQKKVRYRQPTLSPYMFIPDIPLTIKRNEITAFKFNFKLTGG